MTTNQILHKSIWLLWFALVATCPPARSEPVNLLKNPGFSKAESGWLPMGTPGRYSVVNGVGRDGGACLRYQRHEGPPSDENSHVDQLVGVVPDTYYTAGAWFRSDGTLQPVLRVASQHWRTVGTAISDAERGWQCVKVVFYSGGNHSIRLQIFGGSLSKHRETTGGTSLCDDVWLSPLSPRDAAAVQQCSVRIDPSRMGRTVNPLFFGVNTLFWIDDDAARADGKIATYLKQMSCRLLRFPGGTAGDNYDWQTGMLDDRAQFPYKDGPATMGFDEFMQLCRKVGARPILVVNFLTSYLAGDVDAGVRKAVEWVKYCKARGYTVPYWEIGNEEYLNLRVPVADYASAFVKYARAMKAADPGIQIGAVGPTDVHGAGAHDRVPAADIPHLLTLHKNERWAAVREAAWQVPSPIQWWPTLLRVAVSDMDFAIVHDYFGATTSQQRDLGRPIAALREALSNAQPHRAIPIALTEWNLGKPAHVSSVQAALAVARAAGSFVNGGVDMACFWPMRYPGEAYSRRSLLDVTTRLPLPDYAVMQALSQNLKGKLLEIVCPSPDVDCYACRDGDTVVAFLIRQGGGPADMKFTLHIRGLGTESASAFALVPDKNGGQAFVREGLPLHRGSGDCSGVLHANSLAVIHLYL